MALTLAQQTDAARQLAGVLFGGTHVNLLPFVAVTAIINHADLLAGVQAIDAMLDTTLTSATATFGGATTILQALAGSLPAPSSSLTLAQKTTLACMVFLKRGGLV